MNEHPGSAADLPVIRAATAIGPVRMARMATGVFIVASMAFTLLVSRPDLARPLDLTSDASNYLAAGERVAGGGDLYVLSAGDRPVPADNEPYWSVALVAPPPIAVAWAALQAGPEPLVVYLWWIVGGLATLLVALVLAATLPVWGLAGLCLLAFPLAVIAWSGNVTAHFVPLMSAVWWLAGTAPGRRQDPVAGVLVGLAGLVRITPLAMAWWFVLARRWSAVVAVALTVVIGVAISAVVTGAGGWADFLALAQGPIRPSPRSVGGLLEATLGDSPLVPLAPAVVGLVGVLAATALRRRPRAAFAVLLAASVVAVPSFRWESLGLLVACFTPWASLEPLRGLARPPLWRIAVLTGVASVTAVALGLSLPTPRTTVAIRNETAAPVVVRFVMPPGTGSFGFAVPPAFVGSAWADRPGGLSSTLVVLDEECKVLHRAPYRAGFDEIVVTDTKVRVDPRPGDEPVPPSLAYVATCSRVAGAGTP